jgi:hypothetical protein
MGLMKRVVIALLLGIVLSCAISYLVVRHNMSRASLSHSVASHFGGFAGCERRSSGCWRCDIVSQEQSDGWGPYNVVLSGSCWHGTLVRAAGYASGPRVIRGCIGIGDQLRIADRLGLTTLPPPPGYF